MHSLAEHIEISDAVLVERARTGDRFAQRAIYERYVDALHALCMRLLRDPHDAEDVLQDTFVDVLSQLPDLREPAMLRRWITRIAVHKAHRCFRRRRLLNALGLRRGTDYDLGALPARADLSPEQAAELLRLEAALRGVPEPARACWLLRYVEGYRLQEIADLCGCSLATAKRRLAAAEASITTHVELEEPQDE